MMTRPRATYLLLLSAACSAPPSAPIQRTLVTMGTQLVVEAIGPGAAQAAELAAQTVLASDQRWSSWRDDSQLQRVHRAGTPTPVDKAFLAGLAAARDWSEQTGRAFDPGIGPLLELWGIRAGGRDTRPGATELARALAASGIRHFRVRDSAVSRTHPDAQLAEGGFAKGLGLDAALHAARREPGLGFLLLDLGGQLAWWWHAATPPPARHRRVGVAHPRHRARAVAWIELPRAGSLATTGNSERGITVAGERHSHVIDPRSGTPAPDWGSVTVLVTAPQTHTACAADCLSTALYVLGPRDGLALAARLEGVEALFLEHTDDGLQWHTTPGMARRLQRTQNDL